MMSQYGEGATPPFALPTYGAPSRWPLAAVLVTVGLLLSWAATLASTGLLPLPLLASGGVVLGVATTLSRKAALALLALLLIGDVGFSTDFAKMSVSVGSLPIYVTDLVLGVVLAGSILARRWRTTNAVPLVVALAAFTGGAAVFGVASLLDGSDFQFTLYQATPFFYYPTAALALAWNVELDADRPMLIRVALLACAVAVLAGLINAAEGRFVATEEGVPRYIRGDSGTFLAAMFAALLLSRGGNARTELTFFGLGLALLFGVVLSEHRSVWLAMAVAFVAGAAMDRSARVLTRGAVWFGLAMVGFLMALLFQPDLATGTVDRIFSTFDANSVNAAWRLAAWDTALTDIANSPFVGQGFGEPFIFYFWGHEYAGAPHNSLINIAWYMGLLGLALFALVQAAFVVRVLRYRERLSAYGWRPAIVVAAWLSLLTVAVFNVILESPVGALPFWLVLGLPFGSLNEPQEISG